MVARKDIARSSASKSTAPKKPVAQKVTEEIAPEETIPEEHGTKLIAIIHVLYESHQYKPGDELPTNNPDMIESWIEAGSAAWLNEEEI